MSADKKRQGYVNATSRRRKNVNVSFVSGSLKEFASALRVVLFCERTIFISLGLSEKAVLGVCARSHVYALFSYIGLTWLNNNNI